MLKRLILLAGATALVACANPQTDEESTSDVAPAQSQSDQRAYVDPETGELVTPPEQDKAGTTSDQPAAKPAYTVETLDDGSTRIRPKDPARHKLEAERDESGDLQVREFEDEPTE